MSAARRCGRKLRSQNGEEKIWIGIGQGGRSIFELIVSEDRTWTVLVTRTNGMSCVAASGNSWTSYLAPIGEATIAVASIQFASINKLAA